MEWNRILYHMEPLCTSITDPNLSVILWKLSGSMPFGRSTSSREQIFPCHFGMMVKIQSLNPLSIFIFFISLFMSVSSSSKRKLDPEYVEARMYIMKDNRIIPVSGSENRHFGARDPIYAAPLSRKPGNLLCRDVDIGTDGTACHLAVHLKSGNPVITWNGGNSWPSVVSYKLT